MVKNVIVSAIPVRQRKVEYLKTFQLNLRGFLVCGQYFSFLFGVFHSILVLRCACSKNIVKRKNICVLSTTILVCADN